MLLGVSALFVVGAILASAYAARRTVIQPVPYSRKAEETVVHAACRDLSLAAALTSGTLAELYSALLPLAQDVDLSGGSSVSANPASGAAEAVYSLSPAKLALLASLVSELGSEQAAPLICSRALRSELLAVVGGAEPAVASASELPASANELFAAVNELVGLYIDRERFLGAADWTEGQDGEPFRRLYRPSAGRLFSYGMLSVSAAFLAVGFATSAAQLTAVSPGSRLALGAAAVLSVLLLVVAATVVSCVDADTLLIDFRSLFLFGIPSLLLALLYSFFRDGMYAFTLLLLAAALPIVLFALAAFVFSKLRGVSGMGAGDFLVAPIAFAVPTVLYGDLTVIPLLIWFASFSAVAAHLAARIRHGSGRLTPLAFGPHLMWSFLPSLLVAPYLLPRLYGL